MCDGLKTVVVGRFRLELKSEHWTGIHNNYWAQVSGPEGILARFGKVVPAVHPAALARADAERRAMAWIAAQDSK